MYIPNHPRTMSYCSYKRGYKYQVSDKDYEIYLPCLGMYSINTAFIKVDKGLLTIKTGYAWDGPSGPTIDTKNFMRGSLIHDALYQLIREGHLPISLRKTSDEILVEICRQDGMTWIRRKWVLFGVRFGGAFAVESKKAVITAPKNPKSR